MSKNFYDAVRDRRTVYTIGKEEVIAPERVVEILEHAVKHTPSAFNSQSSRAVLLMGGHHEKLWDITREILRAKTGNENFESTDRKIDSFQSGSGTILFFDETETTRALQNKFPSYQENFPIWAEQSNGMLQYILWTALETEGFGVSLQHYSELIETAVRREWSLPDSWKLIAQMPFGKPYAQPGPKEFLPLPDRIRVFR